MYKMITTQGNVGYYDVVRCGIVAEKREGNKIISWVKELPLLWQLFLPIDVDVKKTIDMDK